MDLAGLLNRIKELLSQDSPKGTEAEDGYSIQSESLYQRVHYGNLMTDIEEKADQRWKKPCLG